MCVPSYLFIIMIYFFKFTLLFLTHRQRQMEEERNQKLKQLSDAHERQKREIQENKMRRGQLAESCNFFNSMP